MKKWATKLWAKCWFRIVFISFSLLVLLVLFRNPLFRSIGNFLDAEDELMRTEACFILGGNSFERGNEAIAMYQKDTLWKFVATGANFPSQIQALGITMPECELTSLWLSKKGVPCEALNIGTSTMEESEGILKYCQERGLKKVTIISSALHMRRVRWVFEDKFTQAGVEVSFHGSNADEFNKTNWWKCEEGLIFAQNELVKLGYYLVKY
jgi:uncharacterized SAM-binding protein YcdF (DUF218 family)